MYRSPAFWAIVLGVIVVVALLVLRTLGARLERKKRLERLEERIAALPDEIRESLREKLARHREKTLTRGSGPRERNAGWEQFLTREVGEAEEVAQIHNALLAMGRIKRLERRIAALPEDARDDVAHHLRDQAREMLSQIPDRRRRAAARERFANVVVTVAEANVHLPLDRRLVLQTRFDALPRDRQERIMSALLKFASEGLSSIREAEDRADAWEVRYEELLNEAEDEGRAGVSG